MGGTSSSDAGSSIAIDYTAAPGHAPGVGRYVRELVRALCLEEAPAEGPSLEPHPADPDLHSGRRPLELLEYGRAAVPMEGAALGLPQGAQAHGAARLSVDRRRVRVPRRLIALGRFAPALARALWGPSSASALLHRTAANWPPIGAFPYSLPVLDLPLAGTPLDQRFGEACQAAQGVMVFSQDTGRRAAERYGLSPSTIHFTPVGSEHWERDGFLEGAAAERSSRDILVLGGIRQDRHPRLALAAFERLWERRGGDWERPPRLLFIGHPGDDAGAFTQALEQSPVRSNVRWIRSPDEARMPRAVGGSALLLHLADDECSPVTPLEAARMGLGIVASRLPAFREALGDRATYVSQDDTDGIANALGETLERAFDPTFREGQREAAIPFTWAACAGAHRRAWELMIP